MVGIPLPPIFPFGALARPFLLRFSPCGHAAQRRHARERYVPGTNTLRILNGAGDSIMSRTRMA